MTAQESFAMPPALAPALPDTHASRQRRLRFRWPWSLSLLGNTFRHPLQRWGAESILEGLWGAQQKPGAQSGGLMFARGLSNKSRGTGLGRAGQKSAERTTITLEVPD